MADSAPITWFTEDPTTLLVLGGITLLALIGFLLKTGRGVLLFAMAGVACFMLLAVMMEKLIVTDREKVENAIYEAAAAAEQNNLDLVATYISPALPGVRAEIRNWIGQVTIESVTVGGLNVEMDRKTEPPTATAKFWFVGKGKVKRGDMPYNNFPGRLIVTFRKEGDRWLVIEYERN